VAALITAALAAPYALAQSDRPLDVLIVIDNTGSMRGVIEQARSDAAQVVNAVQQDYPDSRFGLATVADSDVSFRLVEPLSDQPDDVVAALVSPTSPVNAEDSGSPGLPEAYVRAVYEARALPWQSGAGRLIVLVNDDFPKDDNINEGVPTGIQNASFDAETGRDSDATGAVLDWQDQLAALPGEGIILTVLFTGRADYLPYWEWWTEQTGGFARQLGQGDDLADALVDLIEAGAEQAIIDPDPPPEPDVDAPEVVAVVAVLGGAALGITVLNSPARRQRRLIRRHVRLQPTPDSAGTHISTRPAEAARAPTVSLQPRSAPVDHSVIEGK
jgi:hypothetical protein